jgi:hypothetical protein
MSKDPLDKIDQRLRPYFEAAAKIFQTKGEPYPTISREKPEFAMWFEYFQTVVGAVPFVMERALVDYSKSVTVPTLLPQWFDPTFQPTSTYRLPFPAYDEPSPEVQAANVARLRAITAGMVTKPMARKSRSPTNEELRARYSHVKPARVDEDITV